MQRFFILLLLLLSGCAFSSPPRPAVDVVVGRSGELWRLDVKSGTLQQLTSVSPQGSAYQPAVSATGDRVAYTFRPPLPPPVAGQSLVVPPPTIYMQPLAGGTAEALIAAQDEDDTFDTPTWAPDGQQVYATRRRQLFSEQGTYIGPLQEIVSIDVARRSWKAILSNAESAAVTRDGSTLAAIRVLTTTLTPSVVLFDLTTSEERILIDDPRFAALEGLLWSADGQTLYLAASEPLPAPARPGGWDDLFSPGVAEAHGSGWTIWAIGRDGSNLRQLAPTTFEDPRLALAEPNLLVWAASGLWLLDPAAQTTTRLIEPGDVSGISRIP